LNAIEAKIWIAWDVLFEEEEEEEKEEEEEENLGENKSSKRKSTWIKRLII